VSAVLSPVEAQQLLKLFGRYVHDSQCDYVQKPSAECSCERAKLYDKVREIANQASPAEERTNMKAQEGTWTLVAPDGRKWTADSPLRACAAELYSRRSAAECLKNIFSALDAEAAEDAKPVSVKTGVAAVE
jgi:hypothetical protein